MQLRHGSYTLERYDLKMSGRVASYRRGHKTALLIHGERKPNLDGAVHGIPVFPGYLKPAGWCLHTVVGASGEPDRSLGSSHRRLRRLK